MVCLVWGILEFLVLFAFIGILEFPKKHPRTLNHHQKKADAKQRADAKQKKSKKSAIISAKIQRQMMTYTLTLQSDDKSLLRSFKALAREFGAKLEIKEQKRIKALDDAIAEFESGQTEKFESFDDFAKEMRAL